MATSNDTAKSRNDIITLHPKLNANSHKSYTFWKGLKARIRFGQSSLLKLFPSRPLWRGKLSACCGSQNEGSKYDRGDKLSHETSPWHHQLKPAAPLLNFFAEPSICFGPVRSEGRISSTLTQNRCDEVAM